MKRSIASMKILGTCVKNDRIYISGEWSTKALNRAEQIIEFDQVWDELVNLAVEDSRFDSELKKIQNFLKLRIRKFLKRLLIIGERMEDYNLVGLLGNYLLRIKKEMNMATIRRSGSVQHFALNSYIFVKDFLQ